MSTEDTKADPAIRVLIKKQIITLERAAENQYGARSRMKPNELYSIISPSLASSYQSNATKQRVSVEYPTDETLQAKRSKLG